MENDHQNATALFKLEVFFPYQVRLYYKAVSNLLSTVYTSKHNLTVGEWRVIALLNEVEPSTASTIIEHSSMNKVRVSRVIKNLEKRKIIKRQTDDFDKRRILISLTSDGRQILAELIPAMRKLETNLLSGLDEGEIEQLKILMKKIRFQAGKLLSENHI